MKKRRYATKTPRLGQHFLTGRWAANTLVEVAGAGPDDTVLEIGPGTGALTRELLARGARVVVIEKDETLVAGLRKTFAGEIVNGRLTLVEGDVRDFRPDIWNLEAGNYVLAANIPYYITGEILRKFLSSENQPRTMALLVQKEVAERIVALDGKESILSLSVRAYGTPRIAARVSRGNFSPPPKVDSAIIVTERISRAFFDDLDEMHFFRVVRAGFSSKRKLLSRNLATHYGCATSIILRAMATCGIEEKARAEDVPLRKWECLVKLLPW